MKNETLDDLGITMSPEFECDQLLADAANAIARVLQNSIANLGYPVGMGMAPHFETCRHAATQIVERFRSATRAALMAERLAARVAELEAAR